MPNNHSEVFIKPSGTDLRQTVEDMMNALAPGNLNSVGILVKPNMVGPSGPELGHTTGPDLVRAVVLACLDRGARVTVGDNPGGMNRNSRHVAEITGILDASQGCYKPLSEKVVEKIGAETGFPLVISKAVLEADVIINLPKFKTHLLMMATGAIKNVYGYVAGACKARLHLQAPSRKIFAKTICDIFETRPPDINIMDATTVIEGNGPCHGGNLRQVDRLLAGRDALALDTVMARMMNVDPMTLPLIMEADRRGFGKIDETEIEIKGELRPIPDFRMPVTYLARSLSNGDREEISSLYPSKMMDTRVTIRPERKDDQCILCGECAENCPAEAITLEPDFSISDKCINCFCCVELCPEGALEVPDVEAFRHY
jgi:uncharacterized protein (DUF362 family)/NAD-dependent dihydropyrimidine dehydrogenase PreA subunit